MTMDLEDETPEELEDPERTIAEKDQELEKKDQVIEKKDQVIEKKDQALEKALKAFMNQGMSKEEAKKIMGIFHKIDKMRASAAREFFRIIDSNL